MAGAVFDSAHGESVDLLQTVRHQIPSSSRRLPAVVLPPCSLSLLWNKQPPARLVLPVTAGDEPCSGCDNDDDVEQPSTTTRHCHCHCQCSAQRHAVHHTSDVSDSLSDARGLRRPSSAIDDDDSDAVSCIERHHLTTSGRHSPPLLVTSSARRRGARETDTTSERRTCLSRCWTRLTTRQRPRDVVSRGRVDDDCWRLFAGRCRSRVTSRGDTGGLSGDAAPAVTASLCSSPAAVDVRRTSRTGDAALLTERCRRVSEKSHVGCARVVCVILGGLCVAVVGLLIGGLVIVSPAALRHSQSVRLLLITSSFSHLHTTRNELRIVRRRSHAVSLSLSLCVTRVLFLYCTPHDIRS